MPSTSADTQPERTPEKPSEKRSGDSGQRPLRVFVLDCEALSLAVRGDRKMIACLDLAARGEAEVVTSPMTLVEAAPTGKPVGAFCVLGTASTGFSGTRRCPPRFRGFFGMPRR